MSDAELRFAAPNASEVIVSGPVALQEWREKHRVHVPGYRFTPQFRWHKWDGTWVPGKYCRELTPGEWEMRCSRGLLRRVMNDFGLGVGFQVARVAEVDGFIASRPEFSQLRDYQLRVFKSGLAEGWGRVAFATNAGKGAVIALMAAYAQHRGDPVLVLCDEIAVFDALLGELRTWGKFEPTLVRSGSKAVPHGGVVLAMVQTLSRRLKDAGKDKWIAWLKSVRMLLLDEADKSSADSWRAIMSGCPNTDWRVGFSGTFGTSLYEQLLMDELIGPIVDTVKNAELVERGISARPSIQIYGYDATASLGKMPAAKDWWELEPTERRKITFDRAITFNAARHIWIAERLLRPGAPTVIIVDKLEHGTLLAATIEGAVFLDGSASESERIQVLDDFTAGKVTVLVVTRILDRGTNRLGYATDIIFASGEGSATQVLQRMGRGLRRGGGKDQLRLVDIVDKVRAVDRVEKSAATYLSSAAQRRLQVYTQEGFDVQLIPYGR